MSTELIVPTLGESITEATVSKWLKNIGDNFEADEPLVEIETEALARWPLDAVLIIHRYGRLEPGEQIVLVIAASAHRAAALEGCQFLIDWLKTQAPFWKFEETADGGKWVDARSGDELATARWDAADDRHR